MRPGPETGSKHVDIYHISTDVHLPLCQNILRCILVLLVIFIQTQVMTSDMALQYFRVIYEVYATEFQCYLYGTFIM